jgi:hypothetical protein
MSFYKNIFLDAAGLDAVARGHGDNDFLLNGVSARHGENPMPLLYIDKAARYIVRMRDDGLLVAAATLYDGMAGAHAMPGTTIVGQISARAGHKRHGHGVALCHAVFNQAALDRKTLYLTPFETEGAAASAAVVAVHEFFPAVPVLYSGQPAPITAHRRYRLDVTPFGVVPRV